jgi:hypothetical protein
VFSNQFLQYHDTNAWYGRNIHDGDGGWWSVMVSGVGDDGKVRVTGECMRQEAEERCQAFGALSTPRWNPWARQNLLARNFQNEILPPQDRRYYFGVLFREHHHHHLLDIYHIHNRSSRYQHHFRSPSPFSTIINNNITIAMTQLIILILGLCYFL